MMKYTRLTKEQFEELHYEFARFLASQQIDVNEWNALKKNKPEVAEQELDIFSDMVWEKSLQKVKFLEKYEKNAVYCFSIKDKSMKMIAIQITNATVDLTTKKGILWLQQNFRSDKVEILRGEKPFAKERNLEIFELIQRGSIISDGQFYKSLTEIIL